MLSLIRVKNYAVIDEIEVEFGGGFNVMTGETGAGKSILVDALGLALGDRADATAVRQDAERAEISVSFDVPTGHAALAWLAERGLDDETACTLRRLLGAGRPLARIHQRPTRQSAGPEERSAACSSTFTVSTRINRCSTPAINARCSTPTTRSRRSRRRSRSVSRRGKRSLEQLENRRSSSAQRQARDRAAAFPGGRARNARRSSTASRSGCAPSAIGSRTPTG